MSDRDDRAADTLADREGMECRECGGLGYIFVADPIAIDLDSAFDCPACDATGAWKGRQA